MLVERKQSFEISFTYNLLRLIERHEITIKNIHLYLHTINIQWHLAQK